MNRITEIIGLIAVVGCAASGCAMDRGEALTEQAAEVLRGPGRYISAPSPETLPDRDPEDPAKLHLQYARWMEQVGNLPEARQHYRRALQEKPDDLDALLGLARVDRLSGRSDEAERGFRRAQELAPDSPRVAHDVGVFHASQQRWSEAIPLLQRALRDDPDNSEFAYDLAVALAASGQVEAARTYFAQSIGSNGVDYHLGITMAGAGRLQDAERYLERAVQENPNWTEAKEWLRRVRSRTDARLADRRPSPVDAPDGRLPEIPYPQRITD